MATPAAMLNILVQANGVAAARRDLGDLDDTGKRASGTLSKFAKVAAVGVAGALVVGAKAVKGFVDAAAESEKSTAAMQAQLSALGIDYGKHAKQIEKVIAKHSALSGLDDEDLQDSFTNIVRVTGDVNEALKLNGLAADFARAKGIDVAKAGELVGKVAGGNIGVLSRYGITLKDGATASEAIAEMQKRFAGQAKAYGGTAAGAQEKFKVAVENLQEALGERFLPILAKVAGAVADFVNGLYTGEGAGGRFVETIRGIVDWLVKWKDILIPVGVALAAVAAAVGVYRAAVTVATAVQAAFNAVMMANPIGLVVVALAALAAGLVYAYKESETFRNIVNGAWEAIKKVAGPVVEWLATAAVDVWNAIKVAAKAAWDFLKPYLAGIWEGIKTAVTLYFNAYKAVITGVWTAIRTATTALWDWFGPFIRVAWEVARLAVGTQIEMLKALIGPAWEAIKAVTKVAWDAFKKLIVEPVQDAYKTLKGVLGDDGLLGWLKSHAGAIKSAASALAEPFVDAFGKMKDAVKTVLDFLGKVRDAVQEVADWLGKLKVPKLDLPFGGSGGGGGNVGPGRGGPFGSVQSIADASLGWGLSGGRGAGQGYRPGDDGWHGQNRARDLSGSPGAMMAFARMLFSTMGGRLLELIYTPMGMGIKNGRAVDIRSFYGAAVAADHFDHVHVAMANGGHVKRSGWALVGEKGPELAHLPSGTNVYSNSESRGMLGGGWQGDVNVYLDGQLMRGVARVEIAEHERASRGQYVAGRQP